MKTYMGIDVSKGEDKTGVSILTPGAVRERAEREASTARVAVLDVDMAQRDRLIDLWNSEGGKMSKLEVVRDSSMNYYDKMVDLLAKYNARHSQPQLDYKPDETIKPKEKPVASSKKVSDSNVFMVDALAKMLGINLDSSRITSLSLTLTPDCFPSLSVTYDVTDLDSAQRVQRMITEHFDVVQRVDVASPVDPKHAGVHAALNAGAFEGGLTKKW